MRKSTKIAAIVAAAALLALGFAMTSFAAGWTNESGTWVYLDKDGDPVENEWKKATDGVFYWAGDGGVIGSDELVEYNESIYYVKEDGSMLKSAWKKTADEDGEDHWYYFQASGKAKKTSTAWSKITWLSNGQTKSEYFVFDGDGKMLTGWVGQDDGDKTFYEIDNDELKAYQTDNAFYCGGEDNGARVTSDWRQLEIADDDGVVDSAVKSNQKPAVFGSLFPALFGS